jgi:hypothetical protein
MPSGPLSLEDSMTENRDLHGRSDASSDITGGPTADRRSAWEKPVLLPLDVAHSEGNFNNIQDEDDFKDAS